MFISKQFKQVTLLVMMLALSVGLLAACNPADEPVEETAAVENVEEAADTAEEEVAEEEVAEEEVAEEEVAEEEVAEEEPEPTEVPLPENVENGVRISGVTGAMHETLVTLADKYMEANPDVVVTVEDEPTDGTFQALIAAGNQPDLLVTSFGPGLGQLAAENSLSPLEDLPGAADLLAQVEPGAVEQFGGHDYYVPIGADVTLMIYNKDLFTEAGLDPENPPETWDEFLAAAAAIDALPDREDGNQVYGSLFWNEALAWGGWYWNMLQPIYLNANQGECQLVNRLGSDITFDEPECEMAAFFEFAQNAQQFAPPTMEVNFFSRSIGMWPQYGYSWEPNLLNAAEQPMVVGEDVGIAPVPVPNAGDASHTTYGGRALVILKTNPDREARAWDFLQFLMEEENNMQFITELGYLPTLTSLKDDPYFQEPARQAFVDILENGILPQQTASADIAANAVQGIYHQAVVEGALSAEEAVTQAAEAARQALAEGSE